MPGLPLAELLPAALGIALNPPAVVAAILMLSSAHPRRNGLAFLAGWMAGLFLVGAALLVLGDALDAWGGPSRFLLIAKLGLGLLLIVLAVGQWRRHRAAPAPEDEMPGWMRSMAGLSGAKAFAASAGFAAFNPKTLAINAAGVMSIVEAPLSASAEWATLALFVALSSVTVALPVLYYLVAPQHSQRSLDATKRWLIAHNAAVTAAVLLALGILLTMAGLRGLSELQAGLA